MTALLAIAGATVIGPRLGIAGSAGRCSNIGWKLLLQFCAQLIGVDSGGDDDSAGRTVGLPDQPEQQVTVSEVAMMQSLRLPEGKFQ